MSLKYDAVEGVNCDDVVVAFTFEFYTSWIFTFRDYLCPTPTNEHARVECSVVGIFVRNKPFSNYLIYIDTNTEIGYINEFIHQKPLSHTTL